MSQRPPQGQPDRLPRLSPSDRDPARTLDALVRGLDPRSNADEYASRCHTAALEAERMGRSDDAIALVREAAARMSAGRHEPPEELGWLEYTIADLYQRRPSGDPEDNRDAAIHFLERAVTRGIEMRPFLYERAWGSLGDRYARRARGDRADNHRRALAAYEAALRMPPPMSPAQEWALNSHHYGLTLMESENGDPVANTAEALGAHWQAAVAAGEAADESLRERALSACITTLDALVTQLRRGGEPSPFEVALPADSAPVAPDTAWTEELTRIQAVLAILMTEVRPLLYDEPVIEAGKVWQEVASNAQEIQRTSLEGVARSNLGRLLRRLRAPEANDPEIARDLLSAAALQIDPAMHPWAWARNEQELESAWADAAAPARSADERSDSQ